MSRIGRQSNQKEEEKKMMNSSSQQARSMRRKQACSHSTVQEGQNHSSEYINPTHQQTVQSDFLEDSQHQSTAITNQSLKNYNFKRSKKNSGVSVEEDHRAISA